MPAPSTSSGDADDLSPLPRAWLVVALLSVVGCLNYVDPIMLTTMRDSINAAIPMGNDDFSALTMVFLLVYGVLSPLGGCRAGRALGCTSFPRG